MLLHGMNSGGTVIFVLFACLVFRFEISRKDGRKCKLNNNNNSSKKIRIVNGRSGRVREHRNFYGIFFNMHIFISLLVSFQGEHLSKGKRHLSVSKESDLQEADYYDDVKPQPLSPLKQQPKLPQTFQDSSARVHKKQISIREFEMPLLGNIVLEGQFMAASGMYGCFMTMSDGFCLNTKLPDNFRVSLYTTLTVLTW